MNDFTYPEDYAAHILKRMSPTEAIQHVLVTHGLSDRFWRDTVRSLIDAAAPRATSCRDR